MINSKTIRLGGRDMTLINSDQSCLDLYDEINVRHEQACGVIGLLCSIDLATAIESIPDNSVAMAAFGLADTMQEIQTLTKMMFEQVCKQGKPEDA